MHRICFRWVEHRTCCSWPAGCELATGLAQGRFSTIGMFWIVWDFVDICLLIFCTVVQNLRSVNLRLSSTTRSSLYIFLYVFNLWRMISTVRLKPIYQLDAHLEPRHKLILSQVTWRPLILCVCVCGFQQREGFYMNSQYYLRSGERRMFCLCNKKTVAHLCLVVYVLCI